MVIPRLKVGQALTDVITVKTWDQIASAVERLQQIDKLLSSIGKGRGTSEATIPVSNDTGEDLAQYSIVRLDRLKLTNPDQPIHIDPPANRQPFSAKAIADSTEWQKLAIVQTPIKDGEIGPAIISGISYCLVHVTNDDHIRAYPDGTSCKSGAGPLRILYAPQADDEARPAIVLFDYANLHYQAKASTAIAANSTGTVKVWDGELTDIELEVHNDSGSEVPADVLLGIEQEASTGKLYINWQLCDEA